MELSKLLKNRTAQNASWLIFGRIAQMIISFFVGILTARFLGPSNYGLIGYAGAYTAFFMAFCTLGINSILVKEFVLKPDNEGEIIGTTLILRVISSFLSSILIIIIVSVVDVGEKTTLYVVALCSIGTVFHVFEVFNYWFQAKLQSNVTAAASLLAYTVTAIYKVILIVTGKSVYWFAFATSIDYICIAIVLLIAYFRFGGKKLRFSFLCAKDLLKQSYHFILSSLMVSIYGQTDKLMLKQMISETEVGYYSTATAICSMWCFVLTAIIDSFYPSIIEASEKDEELFKKRNKQLYAMIFYISVFVSVIFFIFSPLIIKILYGNEFLPAVNPLRIVTWYTAFSYLGVARNAWIVCEKRQKYLKYLYALAAVANIILNLIFIPLFGASGAAIASLISEALVSVILPFSIKDLRENSSLMIQAIFLKGLKHSDK